MELQASHAGLVSGALFALIALAGALGVRRLRASSRSWGRLILLAALALVALIVPPPLVFLAQGGAFVIANGGHAGSAFIAPYLAICFVAIVGAGVLSGSRREE
jgi:uncharacterized membrane protein YhaH (DUF805 family)